jgi:CheY-like chemotaxis protein
LIFFQEEEKLIIFLDFPFIFLYHAQQFIFSIKASSGVASVKSFLVIDDDKLLAASYEALIKRKYSDALVSQAYNGKEALEAALKSDYSAIVSDINMPVMDGIDFHKALKQEAPLLAKRTAFISANADTLPYINKEGLPFLLKPFKADDFYTMVDSILVKVAKDVSVYHRKYKRQPIQERCILEPANFEYTSIKGEIINLSKGGFGFQYKGKVFPSGFRAKLSLEHLNIVKQEAEMRWVHKINGDIQSGFQWV